MKKGDRVRIRDGMSNVFTDEPDLTKILRRQGFLTVANRWKYSCADPYLILFVEIPMGPFPEDLFVKILE